MHEASPSCPLTTEKPKRHLTTETSAPLSEAERDGDAAREVSKARNFWGRRGRQMAKSATGADETERLPVGGL